MAAVIVNCATGVVSADPDFVQIPIVPASVTPRQAKLALLAEGLLGSVETLIAAADEATQISWNDATEFRRDDPVVLSLGAALGLTEEQIDDLFMAAVLL